MEMRSAIIYWPFGHLLKICLLVFEFFICFCQDVFLSLHFGIFQNSTVQIQLQTYSCFRVLTWVQIILILTQWCEVRMGLGCEVRGMGFGWVPQSWSSPRVVDPNLVLPGVSVGRRCPAGAMAELSLTSALGFRCCSPARAALLWMRLWGKRLKSSRLTWRRNSNGTLRQSLMTVLLWWWSCLRVCRWTEPKASLGANSF